MAGRAKENLPGGSLKYLFVYLKIRILQPSMAQIASITHRWLLSLCRVIQVTWQPLFEWYSPAAGVWGGLRNKGWCGYKIGSNLGHATIVDILVFIMYAKCHAHAKAMRRDIGTFLWPPLLHLVGHALEQLAHKLAARDLEAATLLKGKSGNFRRTPHGNKILLLKRLRNKKSYRRLTMSSHSDLVPAGSGLVKFEPLVECSEYVQLLSKHFSSCHHVQISWDPSTYSGDEVLIATIYSHENNLCGCLPIQFLLPVAATELHEELQALAAKKTITRVAGYTELRALAHAMKSASKDLNNFKLPEDLLWRQLDSNEQRVLEGGQFWVVKTDSQERALQWPGNFSTQKQCILVSITDQGRVNLGVLGYVVYHLGHCILVAFGKQHRSYNDIKNSLKQAGLFKSFLAFALLYNINSAPQGTKVWFLKKQSALKAFIAASNPHCQPCLSYVPLICSERCEKETGHPEQRERLWQELANMRSGQIHGPLTKLMRWYSWWQSAEFYAGQCWMTRLIMLHSSGVGLDEDKLDSSFQLPEGLTPQQEVRQLKMKHGGWSLAPALVTKASMWEREFIVELGRPLWSQYTEMTQAVKSCKDRFQREF